jgi:hypothetical protein
MAEVLVEFTDPVTASTGHQYIARACGAPMGDGMWQGWIEFLPIGGGEVLRSSRETTQPNRQDALYWATGLTTVYLEGALERALKPLERVPPPPIAPPVFPEPAPPVASAPTASEGVLNPFSVYRKGEALLRSQLAALSPWHLVNIIRAYDLSDLDANSLNQTPGPVLIELIVTAVRTQVESGAVS